MSKQTKLRHPATTMSVQLRYTMYYYYYLTMLFNLCYYNYLTIPPTSISYDLNSIFSVMSVK